MIEREYQGKLTEGRGRLYAGVRPMSESSVVEAELPRTSKPPEARVALSLDVQPLGRVPASDEVKKHGKGRTVLPLQAHPLGRILETPGVRKDSKKKDEPVLSEHGPIPESPEVRKYAQSPSSSLPDGDSLDRILERHAEEVRPEFLAAFPGAKKLADKLEVSSDEEDQLLSLMLHELNEHTKQDGEPGHIPLRDWDDEKIALWHGEWQEYTEAFNERREREQKKEEQQLKEAERKKGSNAEELAKIKSEAKARDEKNNTIEGVLSSVKAALLADAKDVRGILSGDLLEKKRKEALNAGDITITPIREATIELIDIFRQGKARTPAQDVKLRKKWKKLEQDYAAELKNDPAARLAIEKARVNVVDINKHLLARREQEPPRMQARADTLTSEPEHPVDSREQESVDMQARADRPTTEPATESPDAVSARARAAVRRHAELQDEIDEKFKKIEKQKNDLMREERNKPLNEVEAEKKARGIWQAEKKRMKPIAELKASIKSSTEDWTKYGWTDEQKREVAGKLGLRVESKAAKDVLTTMLLHGWTGKRAEDFVVHGEKVGVVDVASLFPDDEEVWVALGIAERREKAMAARYMEDPSSIQDLAWQMGYIDERFREGGEYSTLERKIRRVDADHNRVDEEGYFITSAGKRKSIGGKDKTEVDIRFEIHEDVHKDNATLWLRDQIIYLEDQNPHDQLNLLDKVELVAKGQYRKTSLDTMLAARPKYFMGSEREEVPQDILKEVEGGNEALKDKLTTRGVKESFRDLAQQFELEAILGISVRNGDIAFKQSMEDLEEISKLLQQLLDRNPWTRGLYGGKPLLQTLAMLPGRYESPDKMDGEVGAAVLRSFAAYYNLSDPSELVRILGDDNELFSFDGVKGIRDGLVRENVRTYGPQDPDSYLNLREKKDKTGKVIGYENEMIDNAFDIDGNMRVEGLRYKNGKAIGYEGVKGDRTFTKEEMKKEIAKRLPTQGYMNFINFFNKPDPDGNIIEIVKKGIADGVGKKEGLNDINAKYAGMIAFRMAHLFGAAARGDRNATGKNSMVRLERTGAYREKQITDKKKKPGDTEEESMSRGGKHGNHGNIRYYPSLIENFAHIYTKSWHGAYGMGPENGGTSYRKTILDVAYELIDERKPLEEMHKSAEEYANSSPEERKEYDRKMERLQVIYQHKAANELLFDNDAERNWVANQVKRAIVFYGALVGDEGAVDIVGALKYATEIGSYVDPKVKGKMLEMVTMLRYLYDTYGSTQYHAPERVWDDDKKVWRDGTIAESRFGAQVLDDPKFKTKGKIDPLKVQANKGDVRLQVFLSYMGAEIRRAREITRYSTAIRFDNPQVEELLDFMKKALIGDAELSGADISKSRITKSLIGKRRMQYLKKIAGITFGKFYGLEIARQLLLGLRRDPKTMASDGFKEMMQILFSNIFK